MVRRRKKRSALPLRVRFVLHKLWLLRPETHSWKPDQRAFHTHKYRETRGERNSRSICRASPRLRRTAKTPGGLEQGRLASRGIARSERQHRSALPVGL